MKNNKTYYERKNAGLCVECGCHNDREGKTCCSKCAKIKSDMIKYKREKRNNQGLCIECGGNKIDKSKKMCEKCRLKYANKMRKLKNDRKKVYRCYYCGEKQLYTKPNGEKAHYCSKCRETILKYQTDYRKKESKKLWK